jgi:hypothetical protein
LAATGEGVLPVVDLQADHAAELADVVGDQDGVVGHGDRGDREIVGADRR